jgi:AraC-like DNA-binding protein
MIDFPEHDRFEAVREIIGRNIMKVEIERIRDRPNFADLTLRALPDLLIVNGRLTGMQLRRTPALIDSDELLMHVSLRGGFREHQRDIEIGKGEAALFSSRNTGLFSFLDEPFLLLRVPSQVLSPVVGDLDAVMSRPIPQDTEALRLLLNYTGTVRKMSGFAEPDVRHMAAAHIRELIALTLGATRDAANSRGLRAARLHAIKIDIAGHIARPDLSIGEVALRQRVTPRYVQMLFETEGTTFSEFVLNARLVRAHQMLTDPRLANRPIISIALDTGFQDLSYFNRTFRRRFGGTPSQVRAEARR